MGNRNALLVDHLVGDGHIVVDVAGELFAAAKAGSRLESSLILLRQLVPCVHVHHDAVDAGRLIPGRCAPVRSDLLQLQGVVSLGAGELAAVDDAALQGLIQFGSSHGSDVDAQLLSSLTSHHAAQTDLHLLHIGNGGDGLYGADAGLRGVGDQREIVHVVLAVHFLVAVQTAGLIDPGVVVQRGEVVHNGGQQLERGVLAGPVAAPVAAALDGALADIVEQLAGGAKLAFGIVGYSEAAAGELAEDLTEALIHGEVDVAGAPGGTHLPGNHGQVTVAAGHCVGVGRVHDAGISATAAEQRHGCRCCQQECEDFLFHAFFSLRFCCAFRYFAARHHTSKA